MGSKDGAGCTEMVSWLAVSMVRDGVSCTGGSPKLAIFFLTRGSRTALTGGPSSKLGVSTTGGLPKLALGFDFGTTFAGDSGGVLVDLVV